MMLKSLALFQFYFIGQKSKGREMTPFFNSKKIFSAQKIDIIESSFDFINLNHNHERFEFRGNLEEKKLNIKNVSICLSINIDKFTSKLLPILDLVENSDTSNVGRRLQLSIG